jgi:hypothetical protein
MNAMDNKPLQSAGAKAGNISIDNTLQVIVHAPVPEGIEDRIHAALRAAPRRSRVLAWPAVETTVFWGNSWLRTAAAAAIVFVVAGGGWGVYMRVQRPESKVIVMPMTQPAAAGGGFSSAGAIRTPATVKGPVVMQPANPAKAKHRKKPAAAKAQPVPVPIAAAK